MEGHPVLGYVILMEPWCQSLAEPKLESPELPLLGCVDLACEGLQNTSSQNRAVQAMPPLKMPLGLCGLFGAVGIGSQRMLGEA